MLHEMVTTATAGVGCSHLNSNSFLCLLASGMRIPERSDGSRSFEVSGTHTVPGHQDLLFDETQGCRDEKRKFTNGALQVTGRGDSPVSTTRSWTVCPSSCRHCTVVGLRVPCTGSWNAKAQRGQGACPGHPAGLRPVLTPKPVLLRPTENVVRRRGGDFTLTPLQSVSHIVGTYYDMFAE